MPRLGFGEERLDPHLAFAHRFGIGRGGVVRLHAAQVGLMVPPSSQHVSPGMPLPAVQHHCQCRCIGRSPCDRHTGVRSLLGFGAEGLPSRTAGTVRVIVHGTEEPEILALIAGIVTPAQTTVEILQPHAAAP